MYFVKILKLEGDATRTDSVLPTGIEIVGKVAERSMAVDYADLWERHQRVAAVWIEPAVDVN